MNTVLSGPLDQAPDLTSDDAAKALAAELAELDLGSWDHAVLGWVILAERGYVATVASWVHRARVRGFSEAAELIEQRAREIADGTPGTGPVRRGQG